ncbi:MAG: hypothetical protein ABW124_22250 [Candidatus Thiodiazotropha sp. 6PLUC9]
MIEKEILDGLQELSDTAFPRTCSNCGREYASLDDFIKETQQLKGRTGLLENIGCPEEGDEPIVELYRNCICGSTLMEFFSNRRDTSEKGQRRRAVFEKTLASMVENGIPRDEARIELIAVLRYGKSHILEKLGIQIKLS